MFRQRFAPKLVALALFANQAYLPACRGSHGNNAGAIPYISQEIRGFASSTPILLCSGGANKQLPSPGASPKSTPPPPLRPCSRTQEKLDELNKDNYGKPVWETYFFKTDDSAKVPKKFKGDPRLADDSLRCIECGCTIAEHEATSSNSQFWRDESGLLVDLKAASLVNVPTAKKTLKALELSTHAWPCAQKYRDRVMFVRDKTESYEKHAQWVHSMLSNEKSVLLIGDPGIGKSFFGNYFLWYLVTNHQSQKFLYNCRGERWWYYDGSVLRSCDAQPKSAQLPTKDAPDTFYIHDCSGLNKLGPDTPYRRTLCISSPREDQYEEWGKQDVPSTLEFDTWSDSEIDDLISWRKLDVKKVKAYAKEFGNVPRWIISDDRAKERRAAMRRAIDQLCADHNATSILI